MKTNDTKKQISIFADKLIHTRGYHGFSYNDIANEIGIRKASVHHHFPTKEGLVIAIIDFHIFRFKRWLDHHNGKDPIEYIEAYKEMFRYLSHNCTQICPVGMLMAEYTTLPSSIQSKVDEITSIQVDWLINVLKQGQLKKMFKDFEPTTKAKLILTVFSGVLKNIRISKDMHEFDVVTSDIIDSLKREIHV